MQEPIDTQREGSLQANQTKRTTYARNSNLNPGDSKVLLPNNGLDRNGLFRAPVRFRGPNSDGGWDGRGVPPQTSGNGQASSSDRRGSDSTSSSVILGEHEKDVVRKQLSAGQQVNLAIASEAILNNSQRKPKYSVVRIFAISVLCELCVVIGYLIGYLIGWAVSR